METWIFRANTRELAVEELLTGAFAQRRLVNWPVRQHRDYVEEGDQVYIWHSDPIGDGAIVAFGEVARPIRMRTPSSVERHLYLNQEPTPMVQLQINDLRLTPGEGRLPKVLMLAHPRLRLLPFLRWDEWYDWPLNEVEAKDIATMWESSVPQRFRLM